MNSKKKHNINYIKPAEPAFLTRFKQQAGYVEGPSVDTKKEKLEEFDDEDFEERDDEKPVVVVMNEGDFTAEEADLYQQVKKEVDAIDKADLSQRVIFKRKKDKTESNTESGTEKSSSSNEIKKKKKDKIESSTEESSNSKEVKKKKKEKPKPTKSVLSFNDDEEEE